MDNPIVEVEQLDNLEWLNARLAADAKQTEIRAVTAEAEVLAIRANGVLKRGVRYQDYRDSPGKWNLLRLQRGLSHHLLLLRASCCCWWRLPR
jgi:hypothetical protein